MPKFVDTFPISSCSLSPVGHWAYIEFTRPSESVLEIFGTSNIRSIYVLRPGSLMKLIWIRVSIILLREQQPVQKGLLNIEQE